MSEPRSVAALLSVAERVLDDSQQLFEDHDRPRIARDLLAAALSLEPEFDFDDGFDASFEPPRRIRERYLAFVARRAAGEPAPFITGKTLFYGLEMSVRPGAFVPRPSSELMVTRALKRLRALREPIVVDLCTGAGPIALTVAHERQDAHVWGTDISDEGLKQARGNARSLGLSNIYFRRGDLYGAVPASLRGGVHLITAHVPYVPVGELGDLPAEVTEHEPVFTLTDQSDDGFDLMSRAISEAPGWLRPGGWLLLEMSEDFAPRARRLCRKAGLEDKGAAMDDDRLSAIVEARAGTGRR
ncbi:MAG: release factor glutamine methyltransferase [Actinomycetota bacterium]|jgi:release factor glutamine methyltransferase|nr:release factor glutamine methyltransferase [Actinomycetota bacterium]